jgi:hypothetical protein
MIAAASEVNGNSIPGTNDPHLVRVQSVQLITDSGAL